MKIIRNRKTKLVFLSFVLLILTACSVATVTENEYKEDRLIVTYLDVGQADCILVQEPTGKTMLIDAGNNGDKEYILGYLNKIKIHTIDYLIGTHPHEDHIGSLDKVVDNFNIKTILMPKVSSNTKTFEDVLNSINDKSLKITTPVPGSTFYLGNAKCTILSPISDEYESTNNYSITLKMEYGETSFLFTGDAEKEAEEEMIKKWENILKSNILKIGHHGSSSSSTEAFINKVKPDLAVISVGKDNDYKHPHKETIDRLKKYNIPILRTDEVGDIIIYSDGNNIYRQDNTIIETNQNFNNNQGLQTPNVVIKDIDKVKELVILKNNESEDVDLSNWIIVSVTGSSSQTFSIPERTIIKADGILTLASGDSEGDVILTNNNIWSNSKSDPGELYDNAGKLISRWDD